MADMLCMLPFVLAAGNLNNTTCFILNSKTEVKIVVDFLLIVILNFYILLWILSFLQQCSSSVIKDSFDPRILNNCQKMRS